MEDLFSSEIAELESFIDSYVGEANVETIPPEVSKCNSNTKSEEINEIATNLKRTTSQQSEDYNDFQEELLHHQNKPENLFQNGNSDQFPTFEKWKVQAGDTPTNYQTNTQYAVYNNMPGLGYVSAPDSERFVQNMQGYHEHVFYHPQHPGLPATTFPPYYSMPDPMLMNTSNPQPLMGYDSNFHKQQPNHQTPKSTQMGGKSPQPSNNKYTPPNRRHSGNSVSSVTSSDSIPKRKHSGRKDKRTSQSSESDLDWRRPKENGFIRNDSSNKTQSNSNKAKAENSRSNKGSRGQESRKKFTPPKGKADRPLHSRQSSNSSSTDGGNMPASKYISGRSKAEVRSWLKNDRADANNSTSIEKQMKKMEISQSKDLPRLIKTAQSYITNERKLREVAEMVCSKAMRNHLFAENGAKLCNEMSRQMVDGTNFRTVILNIVQGHFKNRHHMMMTSIKNPRDNVWIGFSTFLIDLFIHLRTSSNERIKALNNPVFDCLFQMLNEDNVTSDIIRCFRVNLIKVGSILAEVNNKKLSELISLLRDKCVLPNQLPTEARCDLLEALETYARGWKPHTLDNELFYK